MEPILSISGLTKSHGNRRVLTGVDLDVHKGELLGLVGENGAGKSTLMNILAGVYKADEGTISLAGRPYSADTEADARAKGIGIIKQKIEIDPDLTVAQAIFRGTYQGGRAHEELRRPAEWLLNDIGIDINVDAHLRDLPRPQYGLVEAARVLADDAQVVIMDEVAATFNVMEIDELHFITSRLTRQGRSVIYISHRLNDVLAISGRVAVLRDGEIAHLRDSHELNADQLGELMLDREVNVEHLRHGHVSDDEVLTVSGMRLAPLEGIDFALRRGEVVAFTGSRNSGMHQIAGGLIGETPAEFDTLLVQGQEREITKPEHAIALRISYLSDSDDELGIGSDESIARSLMLGGWDPNLDFAEEVEALRGAIAVIQELEIKTRNLRGRVGSLSGGDQHKLRLTKWMATDSDIMILNSPTRGLDVWARQEVYQMLADLTNTGRSAILISSDPEELHQWSDRVAVLDEGRIVDWLRPAEMDVATLSKKISDARRDIA